jgi:hypothetical protein
VVTVVSEEPAASICRLDHFFPKIKDCKWKGVFVLIPFLCKSESKLKVNLPVEAQQLTHGET